MEQVAETVLVKHEQVAVQAGTVLLGEQEVCEQTVEETVLSGGWVLELDERRHF
jgi:hypothetical protein